MAKKSRQTRMDRERAAELVREQERRRRRRSVLVQLGVGAVAVALVAAAVIAVLSTRDDPGAPVSGSGAPDGVRADGSYLVGEPDAPVTVEVVEDLQCPVCQQFEAAAGDLLAGYADGSDVNVAYRGVAFLDRMSSTEYSSRALNASACVMGEGPDVWSAFHRQIFVAQPPEGGTGLPDDTLVDLAGSSGADLAAVEECVDDGRYRDWVASVTAEVAADGVTATPTVLVNGQKLPSADPATIQAAVEAAVAAEGAS